MFKVSYVFGKYLIQSVRIPPSPLGDFEALRLGGEEAWRDEERRIKKRSKERYFGALWLGETKRGEEERDPKRGILESWGCLLGRMWGASGLNFGVLGVSWAALGRSLGLGGEI